MKVMQIVIGEKLAVYVERTVLRALAKRLKAEDGHFKKPVLIPVTHVAVGGEFIKNLEKALEKI